MAGRESIITLTAKQTRSGAMPSFARLAATVGLMMTGVMGASADIAYLRAADLGVAMQLTNIARDVGEDFGRGRVYLTRTLCEEVKLDTRTLG